MDDGHMQRLRSYSTPQPDQCFSAAQESVCWAVREIARLQAIVDKLPKTADDVPVVPGMELWAPAHMAWDVRQGREPRASLSDDVVHTKEYYSTREAAEAARYAKQGSSDGPRHE
jgi:hypothetical protein